MRAGMDHTRYQQLRHPADMPENKIGCHPENSDHLNISNPEPGYTYYWQHREEAAIRTMGRKGWWVVRQEDQEFTAIGKNDDLAAAGIDSSPASKGLVLMKTTTENYRQLQAAEEARSRSRFDGAASGSDYLAKDNVTGSSRAPETSSQRRVYFAKSEHGMTDIDRPGGGGA